MRFLFSTRIDRLTYLWRHVLALVILGLAPVIFGAITKSDSDSSVTWFFGIALGGLITIIVLGLFYYVRFAVLARMESIGMPPWYALCLAFPIPVALLNMALALKWAAPEEISSWLLLVFWLSLPFLLIALVFHLALFFFPEDTCRQGSVIQAVMYDIEEGSGRFLIRLFPLLIGFVFILILYDFSAGDMPVIGHLGGVYRGLDDAQSMDNAQLARQIVRGKGFTTEFLRPYALAQMQAYLTAQNVFTPGGGSGELFPPNRFPAGTPRILPDTYNAPGYPCLLAAWFLALKPQFVQTHQEIAARHEYSGDRWIPELNQIFVFLTMGLVFILGLRLFDERVAWISAAAFMLSDVVWRFSVTALSTSFLMFLVTAMLLCAVEAFSASEQASEVEEGSLGRVWLWSFFLALFLAAACLTRLHLLILLAPLLVFFVMLPRSNPALLPFIAILVMGLVGPWFWHMYQVCGNPVGSNLPLLLYGEDANYKGNEIYCATAIPSYEQLFKDASQKEFAGFLWHFERGWSLLGSGPMAVLAIVSVLHQFKRLRVRAFQWLVFGCGLSLIAANNLCTAKPETVDAWNVAVLFLPALLVIGSAFFFVLLERLNLQVRLLGSVIVVTTMALTMLPMFDTLTTPSYNYYNFPPYAPNFINMLGRLAAPDEWITSDMPWATAWYADRASLWLPDSLTDFENYHDNVCPTGILLITPVTLGQSVLDLRSGELKEWYPLLILNITPQQYSQYPQFLQFPLTVHVMTESGGPNYSIWSDRPRWQTLRR